MIFVLHFHISSVLPHEIYSTSAIRPYPAALGPADIAQKTAAEWWKLIMFPGQNSPGPAVHQDLQPEEVAGLANRLADAMASGLEPPRWINRGLLQAAKKIMKGENFVIKSAGRAVEVRAGAPSSWIGIERGTGLEGAQPGSVARAAAPASWRGIQREVGIEGGQSGSVAARRRSQAPASWRGIRRSQPNQVFTSKPQNYR